MDHGITIEGWLQVTIEGWLQVTLQVTMTDTSYPFAYDQIFAARDTTQLDATTWRGSTEYPRSPCH